MQIIHTDFGKAHLAFAGFAPRRVAHFLSEVDLAAKPDPGILALRDVVSVPPLECLYTSGGARIEESKQTFIEPGVRHSSVLAEKIIKMDARPCPPQIQVPAGIATFAEPVFFFGKILDHYGHLLTDSMARLWAFRDVPDKTRLLCLPRGADRRLTPALRVVLGCLDIEESRLLAPTVPTRFAQVLCPLPAIQWSARIYGGFDAPHRCVTARIGAGDPALQSCPVYLSRRGLGQGYRAIQGEEELEQRLAREGFAIVRPETLSLADQIAIFQSDYPVVAVMGSALHTLLFRSRAQGKPVGVLAENDVHGRFLLADAVKGSRAAYISCLTTVAQHQGSSGIAYQDKTMVLDVDAAMEALHGLGLLRGAAAPVPPARPDVLAVEGDITPEAKLFVRPRFNPKTRGLDKIREGDVLKVTNQRDGIWKAIAVEVRTDPVKGLLIRIAPIKRFAGGVVPA